MKLDYRFVVLGLFLTVGISSITPTLTNAQSLLPRTSPGVSPSSVTSGQAPAVPINLTISPINIQIETDPGKAVPSQIRLRNNTNVDERLKISVGSFTADQNGDRPLLIEPNDTDEFLSWIKFDNQEFDAKASEWVTIPFTFSPPEDAALAYYYSVIIQRATKPGQTDGQAVVEGAPAVLILATVNSPHVKRELRLSEFTAKYPVVEYLPQEFVAKIQNTGNIHLGPSGNVFIDGSTKKDIATLTLNEGARVILPQTTREFVVTWKDGFPVRKTKDNAEDKASESGFEFRGVQFDLSKAHKFRMGQYTAHLLMVYDNGERDVPVESFVSFWVIPWKILLIGLVIAIFVGLGLRSVLAPLFRVFKKKGPTTS